VTTSPLPRACLSAAATLAAACGGGDGNRPIDAAGSDAVVGGADAYDISARPYDLFVPSGYVAGTPTPLVVLLHGYGASGAGQESYFRLQPVAEAETFLYAMPDGTLDQGGSRFWNGTDACCDLYDTGVDDVAYLTGLIDDVAARYTVDPRRIYFVGHSNGGFMSHRMACDRSDRVAAIVALAGTVWNDPGACPAGAPVAIAHAHGTTDDVILYAGGMVFGQATYPSADMTAAIWRTKNGCTGTAAGGTLDLDNLPGPETAVTRGTGCAAGGTVELWRMEGVAHIPSLTADWPTTVWAFLAANPKP
jgi:polyhydroxybutyrate depolymerase